MRKSSKVVEEEIIDLPDGRTLYYGRREAVLRITVKGAFAMVEKMTQQAAQEAAGKADKAIHSAITKELSAMGHKRMIVETDTTARGIRVNKPAKMRYTIYLLADGDDRETALGIAETMAGPVRKALEAHGFTVSEKRERSRCKAAPDGK